MIHIGAPWGVVSWVNNRPADRVLVRFLAWAGRVRHAVRAGSSANFYLSVRESKQRDGITTILYNYTNISPLH